MYRYETHLHTSPVSKCAKAGVRETLEFYKKAGYDGIFITNHFLDGSISCDRNAPYRERLEFFFSDYEEAARLAPEIGIKVFPGAELSYRGTDFLIYGIEKEFYAAHPEIMDMTKEEELQFLMDNGAFIVQAHPFRFGERQIDHIRLYYDKVHAVEVINAGRTDMQNRLAAIYAEAFGHLKFAGTDNHRAGRQPRFAGMQSDRPINSVREFIEACKNGEMSIFTAERSEFPPEDE